MEDVYFYYIIAAILWLWIMHALIRSATRATECRDLMKAQVRMLSKLLEEKGMNRDELNDLVEPYWKKTGSSVEPLSRLGI